MITLKKRKLKPIVLNAFLGDGTIVEQSTGSYLKFTSINIDWINYKRDLCRKYNPTNYRIQKSGYGSDKPVYTFSIPQHEDVSVIHSYTMSECIEMITKYDLIMWYLDDGTYHQKKHFMHIYCNMLTKDETELLADKINKLYPGKPPKMRIDRKSDGREYPYLYIPVPTSRLIKADVSDFIETNGIYTMRYKVGM